MARTVSLTRRRFLTQMSLGSAALALSTPSPINAAIEPAIKRLAGCHYLDWKGSVMLNKLTHAVFAEQIGSKFRLKENEGPSIDLDLVEATALGKNARLPNKEMRDPFSIILRAPKDTTLPQKTYTFEHDHIGTFAMFIVPVGADDNGVRYEAVFN